MNTTSSKLSFHALNGLEEAERKERITDDILRSNTAKQVAQLIKRNSAPKLSYNGSNKYFRNLEEQERLRLLSDLDQARLSKSRAMSVSYLIKNANCPTLSPFYQGSKRVTRRLEETERRRRISDLDECRARKAHAMQASDYVRVDGDSIRARFNQPKPLIDVATTKGKLILSQAKEATSSLLPTKMTAFFKNAFDTVKNSNTAASFRELVHTAVNTVVGSSISIDAVVAWEEAERVRRVAEDPSGNAIGNAKRVAQILAFAKFPILTGSKGFYTHTRKMEEWERSRRLANKMECQNNRMQAAEISRMIEHLGWPLISSAKNLHLTNSSLVFEEERRRRFSDKKGEVITRENARKVASFVSAVLPKNKSKTWNYTAQLEEKERAYRVKYGGEYAVHNAHRQAQVIAEIGEPFIYSTKKTIPVEKLTKSGESEERKARSMQRSIMSQKMDQLTTIKQMQRLAKEPVSQEEQFLSFDTKLMEESERRNRLKNKEQQRQALVNANSVARLIKQKNPYKKSEKTQEPVKKATNTQAADKHVIESVTKVFASKLNLAKAIKVPSTSFPSN